MSSSVEFDFDINELFESAVTIVRNLPKEGAFKPSDELKLKFYAYFKQATEGPNKTPKPRFYHIVDNYKWSAWKKLGDMPMSEAKKHYVDQLKQAMESIPVSDKEETEHMKDALGKKFYDYWCQHRYAKGQGGNNSIKLNQASQEQFKAGVRVDSNCNIDNQSACSQSSSGYNTPTTFESETRQIVDDKLSINIALTLIRLQNGLDRLFA